MKTLARFFVANLGAVGRRGSAVFVLSLCSALGCWTTGLVSAAEAGEESGIASGAHTTIELELMPEKYQDYSWGLLSLFAASPDSIFWFGPVRPNIHSWLSPSVICRDTTDFEIDFCTEAGERLETFAFEQVAPAFYRIRFRDGNYPGAGFFTLRFRHADVVVYEAKFAK